MDQNTVLIALAIDENLRTIAIPTNGVVFGVVGDVEVNRVQFVLPRYFRGFDLTEFTARVNYANPNGDANYYEADDIQDTDGNCTFTWLMGSDVTAYVGDVTFSITLYKKEGDKVSHRFGTRPATGRVLEGYSVEDAVTPTQQKTLVEKISEEVKESLDSYIEDQKQDIDDHGIEVIKQINSSDFINSFLNVLPDSIKNKQETEFVLQWENGGISNVDGSESNSTIRLRTKDYIDINLEISFNVKKDTTHVYWIRIYDKNKNFITNASISNGRIYVNESFQSTESFSLKDVANVCLDGKYIKIVEKNQDKPITSDDSDITATILLSTPELIYNLDNAYIPSNHGAYSSKDISVVYDISDKYKNKAWLKLPANYSPNGIPVPMICFVHGSADFTNINDKMTKNYDKYYNYLRDQGYAVFDCYGYGTKYDSSTGGISNTWGIPLNTLCYNKGISYILRNYNIDPNNIFVACKSLGGLQALSMYYDSSIPFKAFGLLAPELNIFNVYMGYESKTKKLIARELGFSEDVNGVLDFSQGDSVPDGFWNYLTENMSKWLGIFSIWNGLPISNSDRPNYYTKLSSLSDVYRMSLNRPIKIWIAPDDEAVSYTMSKHFISSLNYGGCNGILRTMPKNSGGHHSVDTDANAPVKTDVTTKLGVTYDSVPVAYYELAEWFDQFI